MLIKTTAKSFIIDGVVMPFSKLTVNLCCFASIMIFRLLCSRRCLGNTLIIIIMTHE